jgi:response regulator RpfG family c-di-GMP phosphodiesterase
MSAHVLLLFAPHQASKNHEPSIAAVLERAGYEVVEADSLNKAFALLFVSRKVEAVVVDANNGPIGTEVVESMHALRPGLPLVVASSVEAESCDTDKDVDHTAAILSTLEELLGRCAA